MSKKLNKLKFDDLHNFLHSNGFISRDRAMFKKEVESKRGTYKLQPRFTYKRGDYQVLTPIDNQPWWSLQRMSGSNVTWYLDFPESIPNDLLQRFLLAPFHKEPDEQKIRKSRSKSTGKTKH